MDSISIKATAKVRLIKKDADGNVVDIKEQEIALTEKEAKELWHSQQQE